MHSLYPILLCCVVHNQMYENETSACAELLQNFLENAFGRSDLSRDGTQHGVFGTVIP